MPGTPYETQPAGVRGAIQPAGMFASWVRGILPGAAAAGIYLGWRLHAPIINAWSAPGTAPLITLFPQLSLGVDRITAHAPPGVAGGSPGQRPRRQRSPRSVRHHISLATASGTSLLGIGSAYWSIAFGIAACRVLHGRPHD
jgi:predicted benzoate:H+ symporter BenE